jgi:hypothetical protein
LFYGELSKFEVHQVGPKDYGSQNVSFLAFMGTELTDGKKSIAQIMRYLFIKSPKNQNQRKKINFLDTKIQDPDQDLHF